LKKRKVFVVSGPSGSGKGTLLTRLFRLVKGLSYSVSATTRTPRQGEKPGQDYTFLSNEQFEDYIKSGKFLEWARVHDYLYGTLKEEVEKKLNSSDVVLELDPQGALQVKEKIPNAVLIFILPPAYKDSHDIEKALKELENRLRKRKTESEEYIKKRLETARKELLELDKYDYVVVNDTLPEATNILLDIFNKERDRLEKI